MIGHHDETKVTIVDFLKKRLLGLSLITPHIRSKTFCMLFTESDLQIVLKFCTMIGHYKEKSGKNKQLKNIP